MGDPNEMVMVVPSKKIRFMTKERHSLVSHIQTIAEYKRRGDVENDPEYKQIIPYLVLWDCAPLANNARIFVTHRVANGDERLRGKYSIGTGGHIREPELIEQGMSRELKEEVGIRLQDVTWFLEGILLSDATEVDRVHMGLVYSVYSINGLPKDLKCLEDELEGEWMTLDEIGKIYDNLESWSQLVFDGLKR